MMFAPVVVIIVLTIGLLWPLASAFFSTSETGHLRDDISSGRWLRPFRNASFRDLFKDSIEATTPLLDRPQHTQSCVSPHPKSCYRAGRRKILNLRRP